MRCFDGASHFGGLAGCFLGGWLCSLPFIGFWPTGLILLLGILYGLRYMLHFYNQLEQRDLDDLRNGRL